MKLFDKLWKKKENLVEEHFFRPRWYSVFLNPYFINRRSLFLSIKHFASISNENDRVLDVGCGLKPYRSLFKNLEYIGIDIEGGGHDDRAKHVDKYYDGISIPYENASCGVVICTQVLEHASDPEALINEIARVLKPGGVVLFSMPFIYPEHEEPYDFRRYTKFEHMRILEKSGFKDIRIKKTTGFFGTFGQLLVIFIYESIYFKASILKTLLSIFVFAPMQMVSLLFDKIFNQAGPTMDYVITAKTNE
jgi:SAM-dependent methyltransferase